jgi:hypothetical protein
MGGRNLLWNRHVRVGEMRRCLYCGSNHVLRQRRADLRRLWDMGFPSRMYQSGVRQWRLLGRMFSRRREMRLDRQRRANL